MKTIERRRPGWRGPGRGRALAAGALGMALVLSSCTDPGRGDRGGRWTMAGYDAANSRFAATEKAVSAATVGRLKPRWSIDTKGDVSATPSVVNGIVYFPDWGGYLNAVEAATGRQVWQRKIADITGHPNSFSKSTPTLLGDLLIVGESKSHTHAAEPVPATTTTTTTTGPPEPGPTTTTAPPEPGPTTTAPGDEHGDHEHLVGALAEPDDHGDHDHGAPTTTTTTTTTGSGPVTTGPVTTGPVTTVPRTTTTAGDHDHGDGDGDDHGATEEGGPAHVMAFDRRSGRLVWKTQVEAHPWAGITAQPIVVGHRVIVGVSSSEEPQAESSSYKCCSFRGSMVALNGHNGRMLWQTYTVPPNPSGQTCRAFDPAAETFGGCPISGAAVWNTPAVDAARNTVYFATGNNYTVTDEEYECAKKARAENRPDGNCTRPDNHIESILALDLNNGRIKWTRKLGAFDAWNSQCVRKPNSTWCPSPFGPDYDFGSNTNLFTATIDGVRRDLVGAGQKSGAYWALDANTGEIVWTTLVGPGSALGGIMWGTAYDGRRIYVANSNHFFRPHTLQPSGVVHRGGSWTALDPATGGILWQTASPGAFPNSAMGPVTVANDVVFAGSAAPKTDNMFAMNAVTGEILWRFTAGGSVNSSPSVVDGTLYWGAGYDHQANVGLTTAKKLYAFSLDGA